MAARDQIKRCLNRSLKIGAHVFTCRTEKVPYPPTKEQIKDGATTGRHPTTYGYMSPDDLLIVVNEQVAPSFQLETYIHEILHALIEIDGTRPNFKLGREEAIVQALGHGLTQVLLDNPQIVKIVNVVTRERR